MTTVVVVRSGGFAGLVRRAQAELDGASARRWEQALDTATDAADAAAGEPPRPDAFVYEVSVGGRTAVLGEPALPAELQRLVEQLLAG